MLDEACLLGVGPGTLFSGHPEISLYVGVSPWAPSPGLLGSAEPAEKPGLTSHTSNSEWCPHFPISSEAHLCGPLQPAPLLWSMKIRQKLHHVNHATGAGASAFRASHGGTVSCISTVTQRKRMKVQIIEYF